MGALGAIRGAAWYRGWSATVLALILAVLLSACSAGSILTEPAPSPNAAPKGKTVPPIAFAQISGIPPGKLSAFKQALAGAGSQHDVGFVEGSFQSGVFSLGGTLRALPGNAGVRVVYEWQFRDAEGVLIDTISGEDNAGVYSGADPWGAVTPDVLERVARRTADVMAQKLAAMGYAARLSSLTAPPAQLFARAGPSAGRQIDFETLHGPGLAEIGTTQLANADQTVQHEEIEPWVAAVTPIPGEEVMPKVTVSDEGLAAPPPATDDTGMPGASEVAATEPPVAARPVKEATAVPATAKPGQTAIRAVAVVPVKGSPGPGDGELTSAMRKVLSEAGWPVVSRPQADALTIEGHVKLARKDDQTQSVALRWVVKSPNGKVLGDVKQANDIPAGSLDAGWGGAAAAVAEAAAGGIFDVVKRYR